MKPTHITANFSDLEEAEQAAAALRGMFYEADIYLAGGELYVLPKGISKLSGILYLTNYWQIPLEETVVIGSGLDDLESVEAAGLGVAMGNAPKEVRNRADWITRSNGEDGVWYFVFEHFRKQQPMEFLEKIKDHNGR